MFPRSCLPISKLSMDHEFFSVEAVAFAFLRLPGAPSVGQA